jgi:putative lipoprotein
MPTDSSRHRLVVVWALLVSFAMAGCSPLEPRDEWTGKDKLYHATVSAAIAFAATRAAHNHGHDDCDAARIGFSVALAAGAAKELSDRYVKGTYWSWKDFTYDIVGSALGSLAGSPCG